MNVRIFLATVVLASIVTDPPRALASESDALRARNDAIIVRAIERMEGFDYREDERAQQALERHLARQQGTAEFLRLVKRFQPRGVEAALEQMAIASKSDSDAVEAMRLLAVRREGPVRIRQLLYSPDEATATRAAHVLGLLGDERSAQLLAVIVSDAERPYGVRSTAVRGLARNNVGAETLLALAAESRLSADTRLLAGGLLSRFEDRGIAQRAAEVLPLPQQANQKPLDPLDVLVQAAGDAARGKELFRGAATCSNCHLVDGHGKQVGPDLSEIGNKLSREALFTSILDPSAGISHNYENFVVLLDSGRVVTGLKINETDQAVVIRTAESIDHSLAKAEIEQLKQSEKSIMPDNLHLTVDQQGLIDIVEYMTTLKTPSTPVTP